MQVTIAKLIPKDVKCLTTSIDGVKYYGSEQFILREDLCSKPLKARVEKQFFREIGKDAFRQNKDADYHVELVDYTVKGYVTFNCSHMDIKFYEYFTGLGCKFKVTDGKYSPIGLFKDDEWVGMVLPMKVVSNGEVV